MRGYIREKADEAYNNAFNEGVIEGRKLVAIETTKSLLSESLPIDLIAKIYVLSPAEINKIKAKMET